MSAIMNAVEMPDHLAENLVIFMRQNHGSSPKRRREKEFRELTAGGGDARRYRP
jgi:hypothetical protein